MRREDGWPHADIWDESGNKRWKGFRELIGFMSGHECTSRSWFAKCMPMPRYRTVSTARHKGAVQSVGSLPYHDDRPLNSIMPVSHVVSCTGVLQPLPSRPLSWFGNVEKSRCEHESRLCGGVQRSARAWWEAWLFRRGKGRRCFCRRLLNWVPACGVFRCVGT